MEIDEKVKEAERVLRLAADMSRYYYGKPLIVAYSGGKDSDVLLDIARGCLAPDDFEVVNSHTTVDAPETVYHIRSVFAELEAGGIHTEIRMPTYKGKRTTMWDLIVLKGMPPTRLVRYCCEVLKETTTPHRMVALGVREDESAGRQGRDVFGVRERRKDDREFRSLQHTYAMFKLDKLEQDTYQCRLIEACKKNKDTISNPIYKFSDADIWEYVRIKGVKVNPLYARGYKRVGCIGCPLSGAKQQAREFRDYPKYRENYCRAFDRMLKAREASGRPQLKYHFNSGEEVMRWWLGEDPKQVRFEDLEAGYGNTET